MTEQFEGQRAYKHIEVLSQEIGARVSGTQAEEKAARYVEKELKSYGLNPVTLSFDMENEEATSFKLEILEPNLGEIKTLPLVGSPDTPPEGLTGEVLFAEYPREPYVGPHCEGKIVVLVNGGWLGGNLRDVLKYKPLGLILVGRTMGREPNTFHVIRKDGNKPYELVPMLHITYEDALKLWHSSIKKARMTLKTERSKGKSFAVFAEITGKESPDEIIVVGGHMDSVPRDPGATDNAAGVATVLELARLYAARSSRRTLRFAAWGSEEGAGGGSLKYVLELKRKHKEQKAAADYVEGYSKTDLEKHMLNINLDVLGMSLGNNLCDLDAPQAVGDYVKALSCELGVHHDVKSEHYGSDNLLFAWAGIPAISFSREGVGTQYMHTPKDDIDLIDAHQLEVIGNLLDVFITRTTAQGYTWPFERKVPDTPPEQKKGMQDYIRQVTLLMGEDPSLVD
jgi:aminopeptidase YwaD